MLAGLVAAGCVACVSGATRVSTTDTDPPLFQHNVGGRGNDAEIGGYLRYLHHAGCFVLVPESAPGAAGGERRFVVVWPRGTEPMWRGGELAGVEVFGFGTIRLDEWVTGGGGYANPRTSTIDLPEVAPDCLSGDGEFAILHRISGVRTAAHPPVAAPQGWPARSGRPATPAV